MQLRPAAEPHPGQHRRRYHVRGEINSTVGTAGGTAIPFPGTITFYAGGACGGFTCFAGGMNQADVCGPVLFSGPVTAPTFLPGTYTGFTNRDVTPAPLATVQDMTVTVTPEPGSAALAAAGMLGVATLVRRRRRVRQPVAGWLTLRTA